MRKQLFYFCGRCGIAKIPNYDDSLIGFRCTGCKKQEKPDMADNDGFEFSWGGWLAMAAIFGMIAVCWLAMGCVAIPKDQAITKQVSDSPGSTADRVQGDQATVAGIATRSDSTIAETDQSTSHQSGRVNTSVSERVNAGGNVTTDGWTSIILAIGSVASGPAALVLYMLFQRWKPSRAIIDALKGKPEYLRR